MKLWRPRNLFDYLSLLGLGLLLFLPYSSPNQFFLFSFLRILVYVIYALAWNLQWHGGALSVAHPFFFGLGAYLSVLLAINTFLPVPLTIALAVGIVSIVGFGLGRLIMNLEGWGFALATFGFSVIAIPISGSLVSITGGYGALTFFPFLSYSFALQYYVILLVMVLSIVAIYAIMHSSFGLRLSAIREDKIAAGTLGINVPRYRLYSFVIGNAFAALCGALLTQISGYVDNGVYDVNSGILPIAGSVVGGLGTVGGPILGTFMILSLESFLLFLTPVEGLIATGLIMMIIIVVMPHGLLPYLKGLVGGWKRNPKGL